MSDTPRTDEFFYHYLPPRNSPGRGYDDSQDDSIEFARSLERELASARVEQSRTPEDQRWRALMTAGVCYHNFADGPFKPIWSGSKRIWFHETDDVENNTLAEAMDAYDRGYAERNCTCHPDDNPPRPCPRKYALSECRAAAGGAPVVDTLDDIDRMADLALDAENPIDFQAAVIGLRNAVAARRRAVHALDVPPKMERQLDYALGLLASLREETTPVLGETGALCRAIDDFIESGEVPVNVKLEGASEEQKP